MEFSRQTLGDPTVLIRSLGILPPIDSAVSRTAATKLAKKAAFLDHQAWICSATLCTPGKPTPGKPKELCCIVPIGEGMNSG